MKLRRSAFYNDHLHLTRWDLCKLFFGNKLEASGLTISPRTFLKDVSQEWPRSQSSHPQPLHAEEVKHKEVTAFCPECKKESLIVTVLNSGKGFNHSFGQVEHWFSGDSRCTSCGHHGPYSDSSL
jgi:hypothetical protein